MKSLIHLSVFLLLGLISTGCLSLNLGTDTSMPDYDFEGLGSAYASLTEIPPFDGTILEAHLIDDEQTDQDELVSLEIWPLGRIDVGLFGARLKLLPIELGAGTLFYAPLPMYDPLFGEVKVEAEAE